MVAFSFGLDFSFLHLISGTTDMLCACHHGWYFCALSLTLLAPCKDVCTLYFNQYDYFILLTQHEYHIHSTGKDAPDKKSEQLI